MSTFSRTAAMPLFLLALAASANALNAMTYKGCYASSSGLTYANSDQYQTSGLCQPVCVGKSDAVLGLTNGGDCWCGDQLPPASSKVDDSKCSTGCNGFGANKCGGTGYWTVYLSGITNDVTNAGASSSGSGSSSSSSSETDSSSSSSSTSASSTTPSVVTSVSPGNTVVVTVSASAAAQSQTGSNSSSGSGTNVAGIAAGVVVGVLAVAAIIGGVFFWLRHRRRQQAEEDFKRSAQVSDFMSGSNERKPPTTAYSQMSDSRLDPEAGRRNSVGSMADEQDYSRRILRVANPDH